MPPLPPLPEDLFRADQVRELDRIAIQEFGIPGGVLMERAGAGAFRVLRHFWPAARRIAVVCGIGNNGGDGYVVARRARAAGLQVAVTQVGEVTRLTGEALAAHRQLQAAGLTADPFRAEALAGAEVVVDAVFGTGLERQVSGPFAEALAAIRACGSPVLSLDIPSGLHADTGMILGTGVQATVTVTFIALKQGMFTGVGRGYCGHIVFDDLGVPPEVSARLAPQARRLAYANLHCLLTPRSRTGHKGDYGHVLVIGGEQGYGGATRLAGEAAARVGAGLVSVATRPQHASWLPASRPELMGHGVQTAEELEPLLERANVVAIGPGLGQASWGEALLQAALRSSKPLVVDADALNLLARRGQGQRRSEWILTPHPGEAGRLLQCTPGEVQADRFKATAELVARYGGTCVLKGSGTLVLTEGGTMEVVQEGNPGMGSGGMGDLLTGVIAGLVAQGFTMADAARLGACLHGHAGDLAAAEGGERGLLAGDLMPFLRSLANPREAHVRA